MKKINKCREGITAAKQIYFSPSFFNITMDAFYPLVSMRFKYCSSVCYAYPQKEQKILYILLLYSLEKNKGHATQNLSNVKEYAKKNKMDIVVTVSKKSPSYQKAKAFYEKVGFKLLGEDEKQFYYRIKNDTLKNHNNSINETLQHTLSRKDIYSIKENIALSLCLLAYPFRMRKSNPVAVDTISKWLKQNVLE